MPDGKDQTTKAEKRLLDAVRRAIRELERGKPQHALVILSGAELRTPSEPSESDKV